MYACYRGNDKCIEALLPLMDDKEINRQDRDGNTALHYAFLKNHFNVIKVLLCGKYKVDTFITNSVSFLVSGIFIFHFQLFFFYHISG